MPRILLADDDVELCAMLKEFLVSEGFEVDTAHDGAAVLAAAARENFDLVVLDVMMPVMNGFDVLRQLRARQLTPVLMLTARDEVGDRVRGLDAGADDYLVKPFSLLELSARLRALARRDNRSRPTVLSEGDLKLDPAAKRAWRGDAQLKLSPKEFALLELFLRHSGDVLTRSQIIESVWDFAFDGTSNVVDQYVKYVRDIVDTPFGRHDIETVRGMGYRLRHQPSE